MPDAYIHSLGHVQPTQLPVGRPPCAADPEAMFAKHVEDQRYAARSYCGRCPFQIRCAATALDSRIEFGVWGGLTELERRALLAAHPRIRRWRPLLEAVTRNEWRRLTLTA